MKNYPIFSLIYFYLPDLDAKYERHVNKANLLKFDKERIGYAHDLKSDLIE